MVVSLPFFVSLRTSVRLLADSATNLKGAKQMKINDNQNQTRIYKIFMPHEKQWVEVTQTQHYAYYRDIWATKKRAQAHHQCMCPKNKHWLCDGDCLIHIIKRLGQAVLRERRLKP